MVTAGAVENLHECWASLDSLLDGLTAEQWQAPSLCPDWTVRDVVTHIAAIEHLMSGEAPGSMSESIPFEKANAFVTESQDLDDAALLDRWRRLATTRRAELAQVTEADLERPSLSPVGPGTFGRFLQIRVFDCWVHEQDIRVPLARPGHQGGGAAEMAIDEIERSLPYIVGKKVGLPDGKSITIEIHGPVQRAMHLVVDGRAGAVDALVDPDVVLRADSTTFALLACGRIDPQGPIDDGTVTWEGDQQWADAAARHLAFTM